MKKITVLALHLGYGGIEKCITTLCNCLCNDYEINIISTYKLYDKPVFDLNEKIKVKYLISDLKPNKKELKESLKKIKILSFMKEIVKSIKILKLKKLLMINYIKKCDSDIIISTRDIHNKWLGKFAKTNVIKIGWEHNYHNNDKKYINKVISSVKKLDYFVVVSNSLKEFYENKIKAKCIYIPNALEYYPENHSLLDEKNIISIGRLSYEKGYDELIEVFYEVNKFYPDWMLNIIGDGVEYSKIKSEIKKYNLVNNVVLHGYQNKDYINKSLLNSSIYVMPSRSESFGIVLLEAMSHGIPCIAFDRANGAKEIISDNIYGFLIKDSNKEEMVNKIIKLIDNYDLRKSMGDNAVIKAREYNTSIIKDKWTDLFKQIK